MSDFLYLQVAFGGRGGEYFTQEIHVKIIFFAMLLYN